MLMITFSPSRGVSFHEERRNVSHEKTLFKQQNRIELSRGLIILGGDYPEVSCPGAIYFGGNCPGGYFPGAIIYGENCQGKFS